MATLFISDLHLDENRPHTIEAFFRFVAQKAASAEALYILGDFFDAWVGDDEDTVLADKVRQALRTLTTQGVPVYIMHGNRDFLLGERFAQDTGCALLPDPTVINLYGQRVLLMHGDSLCTGDTAYQQFRAMARSPQWQQSILAKSLAERREIAKMLRDKSMETNSLKAEDIMDVTPEEVVRVMQEHGVQTLIHGHTHRPAIHDLMVNSQPAQRFVLSDWDADCRYLEMGAEGVLTGTSIN